MTRLEKDLNVLNYDFAFGETLLKAECFNIIQPFGHNNK